VDLLVAAGAEVLLHLGDIASTGVLEALVVARDANQAPSPPVHVVFGNVDDVDRLRREALRLGLHVDHPAGQLEVGGKTIAFLHGHVARDFEAALAEGVAYLCHGHTHERRDERLGPSGRTRVINPGALHRAREHTAAILDAAADTVRFIVVHREEA
jgi:predicted phosphodiesterase